MGAPMKRDYDVACERISIARCREILGKEADELSDADVEQVCRHADAVAHVVIDIFLNQHSAHD